MVQAAPEEETSVAPSETTETTETIETAVEPVLVEETAPPAAAVDIVTVDFAAREMDGTQTLESAEGNPVDMMDAAAGYRIGEGERLLVPQDSVDLGRMGSFRLEIEMGLDAVGSEGVFLEVPGLLEGAVEDDGHVFFELATKKGVFGIESTAPVFDDTETRSIALVYDREERSLEMYADNTLVGAATARGQTERDFESTITVGSRDADGLDAWVESFSFATGREAEAETYELPILPPADVTLEDLATEQIEQEQTAEDDAAGPEQMVA